VPTPLLGLQQVEAPPTPFERSDISRKIHSLSMQCQF